MATETQKKKRELQMFGLERISAFTDGMIAIAITLLVLDLKLPNKPDIPIREALIANISTFEAWVVSFFIIGLMWFRHHAITFTMRCADAGIILLNMVFLMFITLVPWALHVRTLYPAAPLATILLTGTLGIAWNLLTMIFFYGMKEKLMIRSRCHRRIMMFSYVTLIIGFSTMILSFVIAFFNVRIALYSWSIPFICYIILYMFVGPGGYFVKAEDYLDPDDDDLNPLLSGQD